MRVFNLMFFLIVFILEFSCRPDNNDQFINDGNNLESFDSLSNTEIVFEDGDTTITSIITDDSTEEPAKPIKSKVSAEDLINAIVVDSKRRKSSSNFDKLVIWECETKYDDNFVPTVYIEVKNSTSRFIKAFEVEGTSVKFSKKIKALIKPYGTYSKSFKLNDVQDLDGGISLRISKFIYTDGSMEVITYDKNKLNY